MKQVTTQTVQSQGTMDNQATQVPRALPVNGMAVLVVQVSTIMVRMRTIVLRPEAPLGQREEPVVFMELISIMAIQPVEVLVEVGLLFLAVVAVADSRVVLVVLMEVQPMLQVAEEVVPTTQAPIRTIQLEQILGMERLLLLFCLKRVPMHLQ